MEVKDFIVIKRNVKYPRIELKGIPTLILPYGYYANPEEIIEKHKYWIEKKMRFIKEIEEKYSGRKICERTDDKLKEIVLRLVKRYSIKIGVRVNKITFRDMRSKWGSCNKKGNINFNLKLKYLPYTLIKYVVLHEMAHLIIPNHKKEFWNYIKNEFKNPERYEEMLYGYWFLCIKMQDWEGR
ncbi:MAG: M48 family metallopeptidase [bacterium]|nr:M48 family metallopeptidase [bacterium]